MSALMTTELLDGPGLACIVRRPQARSLRPAIAVVFLHNRDASMFDFVRLGEAIDSRHYVYVFPNAPFPGMAEDETDRCRCWHAPGEGKAIGPASRAWPLLDRCLDDVARMLGPEVRIVLGGFSQGAAYALRFALEHPGRFAGVMALSPSRVADLYYAESWRQRVVPQSIFLAHGLEDPVLSADVNRACRNALEAAGHAVTYREYPIGHELALIEIRDVRTWLRTLSPTPHVASQLDGVAAAI
jgi:phospholipase/carboxylesterase